MASDATLAKQIKETLVQNCVDTWRSRARPMTLEESVSKQWRLGDDGDADRENGALVSDGNPKGYLFVPFDDSAPSDQVLLQQRHVLRGAIRDGDFKAAEALLDEEIEGGAYLFFEGIDRPLSWLKTYEKVGYSPHVVHET